MIRVAINGFGRIGRMIFRAGYQDKKIKFVALNDLTDIENIAYLLKYDSVQGKFPEKISFTSSYLKVGNQKIKVFAEKDPLLLPWKKLGIDIVIESTGLFLTRELAQKHLQAGAKKVLLSAPPRDHTIKTFVYGVNHQEYNRKKDNLISNASCTTNCLAPLAFILDKNFKIVSGLLTTVHAYTASQRIVDGPAKKFRRGRAAAQNIVPTTTGAALTTAQVLPQLKEKINGRAIRVPVLDGSLVDFTCLVKKATTSEEVNLIFKKASQKELKGVLEYSEEELVSTDILGNPSSAIFDSKLTQVINKKLIKVFAWYDNEYGYSCRVIDMLKIMI